MDTPGPNTSAHQALRDQYQQLSNPSPLRDAITDAYCTSEAVAVARLLEQTGVLKKQTADTHQLARHLAQSLRNQMATGQTDLTQSLLHTFSLSEKEGVALMCLAEALLRIPDAQTRDALIRDKVAAGDWESHLDASASPLVSASVWGLIVTGRLISSDHEKGIAASLMHRAAQSGEPLIRKSLEIAMRRVGEQFVIGNTIEQALDKAQPQERIGFRYSYDMLGEAAYTDADARQYTEAYEQAIHAIGRAADHRDIYDSPGISIKLSALHPRYSHAQIKRVMTQLYRRLRHLALLTKRYDISLSIDAEEADRLDISLRLIEQMCFDPLLANWDGLGLAIQAYQKRCPQVVDYLLDLARHSKRRLMIRLVKGAYWDTEIKRAQVAGLNDYPVYTRKAHTDLAYLICAQKLLAAPDACYPQFGTHNAHTLAAVYHLAGREYEANQYEFQCLHGMGEALYRHVVGTDSQDTPALGPPCRIYAPVGAHHTLLAYLARRLLENGANTSFVNQIADVHQPIETLIESPIRLIDKLAQAEGQAGLPHPRIPLPEALFGSARINSKGFDLSNEHALAALTEHLLNHKDHQWRATPIINGQTLSGPSRAVRNPARRSDIVGQIIDATPAQAISGVFAAVKGGASWSQTEPGDRAAALETAATLLEIDTYQFIGLLIREAGKTYANAVAEVRETVDFLRFYALQIKSSFTNDSHTPLGPVVCISPWNFPLSIFTGQVAAALAAGNAVLAKPAEQTPLVAHEMVRLLLKAGIPNSALHFVPGLGETAGAALIADTRIQGVLFTGSLEVAKTISKQLAGRFNEQGSPIPLVAETGGQNAMLVDSSALPEQVVADVLASAFDSAGQRCSALRVLCLQDDIAEPVIQMLKGALAEQNLGDPIALATDIGPLIDDEAKTRINNHIDQLQAQGCAVYQAHSQAKLDRLDGAFIAPTLIEISSILQLEHEVFGPVLHVLRYPRQDFKQLIRQINQLGFGLTFGLHSRIDETITTATGLIKAGNSYVNRNMVGAVVGVQSFGGEGLSGTGPKTGGPLYLPRLLATRPAMAARLAIESNDFARFVDTRLRQTLLNELMALQTWAKLNQHPGLASACEHFAQITPGGTECTLPGPTGERNLYRIKPKEKVLCIAKHDSDLLIQLAALIAVGSSGLVSSKHAKLLATLPRFLVNRVQTIESWPGQQFDIALFHGSRHNATALSQALAQQPGPIIALIALGSGNIHVPLEQLVLERTVSINTAAAGGNADLVSIAAE